jgi:hypothetical protein
MAKPQSLWIRPLPFCLVLLLLLCAVSLRAATILDFEGFPDSTILTTQYPGLTFTNTIILTAGISLNEFEFPPHSGVNVASDNGGPISIAFDTPILGFGGYFTYAEPLTLDAFDATGTQVASATSAFSSNDALFGDPGSSPNEFLSVSSPGGISSLTMAGDPDGGSFVMDDATTTSAVPEPHLFGTILVAVASFVLFCNFKHKFSLIVLCR